jgi:hypothetical protein
MANLIASFIVVGFYFFVHFFQGLPQEVSSLRE